MHLDSTNVDCQDSRSCSIDSIHTVAILRPQTIKEFVYTRLNRLVLKFFTARRDVQNVLIVA